MRAGLQDVLFEPSVFASRDTLSAVHRIQQEHLVTRPHMTDHSFRLSVSNVYHQQLGSATVSRWDSLDNRFLEVNETLDQVIIHPTSERPT